MGEGFLLISLAAPFGFVPYGSRASWLCTFAQVQILTVCNFKKEKFIGGGGDGGGGGSTHL